MPTRLRRPSKIKQLGYTLLLAGFLAYMGFSVVSGQYGIESQDRLKNELIRLEAKNIQLQIAKDKLISQISLFDPEKLDPDILTQRARELLAMVHSDDRIVDFSSDDN